LCHVVILVDLQIYLRKMKLVYTHKENEQIDPKQVHKMPVGADQLHRNNVITADLSGIRLYEHYYERNNAAQHM
jgi:hypothetical protein